MPDNDAKWKDALRKFSMDKSFGPFDWSLEDRVRHGEATGRSIPNAVKEFLKSVKGYFGGPQGGEF